MRPHGVLTERARTLSAQCAERRMRSSGQDANELRHFGDQRRVLEADVANSPVDVVRRPQRRGGRGSRTSTRRAIFHGLSRDALSTTDRAADRSEDDLADRINVAFADRNLRENRTASDDPSWTAKEAASRNTVRTAARTAKPKQIRTASRMGAARGSREARPASPSLARATPLLRRRRARPASASGSPWRSRSDPRGDL